MNSKRKPSGPPAGKSGKGNKPARPRVGRVKPVVPAEQSLTETYDHPPLPDLAPVAEP